MRLRDTQCGLFATGKVLRRFGVPFTHLTNCRLNGQVNYVLEGNLNYTGAVITWLKEDVSLIASASESEQLARQGFPTNQTPKDWLDKPLFRLYNVDKREEFS